MGSNYLPLADWAREAGLVVHEDSGWERRARSSGGFDNGKPWCVMWHHTASDTSPQNDVNYICRNGENAPIANILLDRAGEVWVCAGGATNTNGKGKALATSKGTIPADSMNTYAVGIEAANNGVGGNWSQRQIDAYFALNAVLTAKLGLEPTDCFSHQAYAPDRKIDPATAAAVAGPWRPASINSSGSWSLDDIQSEAQMRAWGYTPVPPLPGPEPGPDPGPGPTPPPFTEDDMRITCALDANGTIWVGDGIKRFALTSMGVFNNYCVLGKAGCYVFVNTSGQIVDNADDLREVGGDTIEALGQVA